MRGQLSRGHMAVPLAAALLALGIQGGFAAPWNVPHHQNAQSSNCTSPDLPYNQTVSWFDEAILDHFDPTDDRTWSQRYFTIEDYWKPPHGPVILHVCGEYTCPGIMPARLFPLELAQAHGALVVSLEHRFFGESQPFANTSTPFLRFLSSRQALNDLAVFTRFFQDTWINQPYGLPTGTLSQWVVIGGSYPGALTGWYREKFPFLSVGGLASSGVVHSIRDFTAFDEQVATSAGRECAAALRSITTAIEEGRSAVAEKLNATQLNAGDFFYMVADAAAEAIQYGHRDVLCNAVTPPFIAGHSALPAFVQFVTSFFFGVMGNSPADYDSVTFSSAIEGGNSRSWWWMKCTELAYWQVAPRTGSIRSHVVNDTYHRDLCGRVFGLDMSLPLSGHEWEKVLPAVNATNTYYGGSTPRVHNTIFSNGIEDPWQWAGVQDTLGPSSPAILVNCSGCAHCVDLYTPSTCDPPELIKERQIVKQAMETWL